jgi:hypothetical protein
LGRPTLGTNRLHLCVPCAATVGKVDEARAVLARLDRIEELESGGAPASVLLAEVRALLHEAESWVRAEPGTTAAAAKALDRCHTALDRPIGESADSVV